MIYFHVYEISLYEDTIERNLIMFIACNFMILKYEEKTRVQPMSSQYFYATIFFVY